MAVPPNKRREAPSEPLKRVLGPTVRAIAGDGEIEVDFGPGRGEVAGKSVIIPEPPRTPSAKDIALARGWADSLALRIGCHDAKIHRRMAPPPGPNTRTELGRGCTRRRDRSVASTGRTRATRPRAVRRMADLQRREIHRRVQAVRADSLRRRRRPCRQLAEVG